MSNLSGGVSFAGDLVLTKALLNAPLPGDGPCEVAWGAWAAEGLSIHRGADSARSAVTSCWSTRAP